MIRLAMRNIGGAYVAGAWLGAEILNHGMAVEPGDLFVLTSDGAHGELTREKFVQLMGEHLESPQELCDIVVQNALDRIGRDNSTILVVRVE